MRAITRTVLAAGVLLGCLVGRAAADPTIEVTGIGGGEMPLTGYTFGAMQTGGTGFGPATKRVVTSDFSNLTITRLVDQFSAEFLRGLVSGVPLGTATIRVPEEFGTTTITLADVLVVSYSVSGTGGSPTESAAMSYSKIQYNSGGKTFCWDVAMRKGC